MRSPMQRKYAAKAAHGARGEQGRKTFPYSIIGRGAYGNLLLTQHAPRARVGEKGVPLLDYKHGHPNGICQQKLTGARCGEQV